MAGRSSRRLTPTERELAIHAVPFGAGVMAHRSKRLLTAAQRRRLMALATTVRLRPGTTVFREGDPLSDIFVVGEGLVKAFREFASGRRRIVAFLFPRDVFGLAEHGRYVNTARTVTQSLIYRIPHESLAAALQRDADLQFRFLCKVTEKLREAQRQAVVLGRPDAIGRVAMFLKMLEPDSATRDPLIPLPMRRTDIAEYLGLSLEAVSRATRTLALRKIVAFVDGHSARVQDRAGFESIVAAA
jgi:CRP/FNR family transcriptional regulator, anaerobic regulatory protein